MNRALALCSAITLALPAATARPAETVSARVVVVLSSDAEPYQQALAGLRREFPVGAAALTVVALHNDTANVAEAVRAIRSATAAPALVITLGTLATRALLARVGNVPVVAGMILNPAELGSARNATAVYLEYPVEIELEWMRRVLPGNRRVGVVYHSAESGRRVDKARGLVSLHAIHIEAPGDLPDALQQLTRADVLWSLNDPMVYNPETARSLLLFSFRNRIPMVGQSRTWVRAGALYALERDYEDVGAQCAELAGRILAGTAAAEIAPAPPRRVRYAVNTRTARDLGVTLPEALLRDAIEVVR